MIPCIVQVRWALLVVACAAFAVWADSWADAPFEAPIEVSARTPLVEVTIGGKGPYKFLIDTGSRATAIDTKLAEELGLRSTRTHGATTSDSLRETFYEIEALDIGGLEFEGVSAKAWQSYPISPGSMPPHGILGTSLFEGFLLVIDNPRRRVTLERGDLPAADGREIFDYVLEDEAPVIPGQVGGLELLLQVHSGGFGPVQLREEHMDVLPLRSEPGRLGHISIDGVEGDLLGSRLDGVLKIGQHAIDRPSIHFCRAFHADHVGYDTLVNFVLTLDQANQRLRLHADQTYDELLTEHAAAIPQLGAGELDLKTAFNSESDKVRLVVILSPT